MSRKITYLADYLLIFFKQILQTVLNIKYSYYQIQPDVSHHYLILFVHIHDLLKRKSKLGNGNLCKTIFKASKLMLLPLLAMLVINLLVFVLSNPSKVSPNPMLEQFSKTKFYHKMQLVTS